MEKTADAFELNLNSVTMKVERLYIEDFMAYRVFFSSTRLPLVVAKVADINAVPFWTSIPEGRLKEAEGVGKLIDDYLNKIY